MSFEAAQTCRLTHKSVCVRVAAALPGFVVPPPAATGRRRRRDVQQRRWLVLRPAGREFYPGS